VVRYSILRLLIFFGCLGLLWLLGLRDRSEQLILLLGAALLSMVISFVVLRPYRQEYSRELSQRLERRAAAKTRAVSDEEAEDTEAAGDDAEYR
jgi:Protein of unknown function (DUF4229)